MLEPSIAPKTTPPNYEALIRFLVQPFLDSSDSLRLDSEVSQARPRIWVRLAFEGTDKGRVLGRGGRNIQAIRTVIDAIAKMSGYSIHLDIYGGANSAGHSNDEFERESGGDKPSSRRPSRRPPNGGPKRSSSK